MNERKNFAVIAEKKPQKGKKFGGLNEYAAYIEMADNAMFHVASFHYKFQFDEFIKKFDIKLKTIRVNETERYGKVEYCVLDKIFKDERFASLESLPEDAKPMKLLSNGYIVDGFYTDKDGVITLWRPNPNYKEIYKPLDLDEHIAFQQAHGIY